MMHSQTERARAQIEVIRPRSWKPAKKAKQTSGLTTDQEDISAEVEDEEENTKNRYISEEEGRDEDAEASVSDDDDPFDLTKTSKRLAVPSCKASSRGNPLGPHPLIAPAPTLSARAHKNLSPSLFRYVSQVKYYSILTT